MGKFPRALRIIGYFAAFLAIYLRRKSSVINPALWTEPNPLPSFEGASAVNDILQQTKLITGSFRGAESLAVDEETGVVYASFNDGTVGTFKQGGEFLGRIFFIGGFLKKKDGNGLSYETNELYRWCMKEALTHELAWNVTGERNCGRPLGLRIHKIADSKLLYVMDAYHGLFTFDIRNKKLSHVITPTTTITASLPNEHLDPVALNTSKFFNDLVVFPDGRVVYTDSSFKYTRSENRNEIVDGEGRGRVFLYTPATTLQRERLQVLACGLHFANGIEIIKKEDKVEGDDEVIVADLGRFRILKFAINRPFLLDNEALQYHGENFHNLQSCVGNETNSSLYKAIKLDNYQLTGVQIFADSVPGLVDNIRIDPITTTTATGKEDDEVVYWAALGSKSTKPFSLVWWCYQNTWFRELMGKLISMRMIEKFIPSYGLVVGYNNQGSIVASLHDNQGKVVKLLSQATRHPITKDLWLGSHSEGYIGIVPADFVNSILPQFH